MKKLLFLALLIVLVPALALASSMTLANDPIMDRANQGISVTLNWTGTPTYTTNQLLDVEGKTVSSYLSGYFFYDISFVPSPTSAPTTYTVTITDAFGLPVGTFSSLSATVGSSVNAATSTLGYYAFALAPHLPYTIAISGNSNASGGGKIIMDFVSAH